jgi:molecular chaperone Hsp33
VTVSVMIAAGLKRGSLIVQIHGEGALRLLVVEVNAALQVRATAEWNNELPLGTPLVDWVGLDGRCVITIDPQQANSKMYQGIVAADQSTIAETLEGYLTNSAQCETRIWLGCEKHTAGGILLQRMPLDSDKASVPECVEEDKELWEQAITLADTVTVAELVNLSSEELLWRLFSSEGEVRVLAPQPISFFCNCNEDRVLNTLQMLGGEDIKALFEEQEGEISVDCQFCGKRYTIGEHHYESLFSPEEKGHWITAGSNTQH